MPTWYARLLTVARSFDRVAIIMIDFVALFAMIPNNSLRGAVTPSGAMVASGSLVVALAG